MKKEQEWSFWVKIVIIGIFGVFLLHMTGSLIYKSKFLPLWEDDDTSSKKSKPINIGQPTRLRIMIMNTITLFFLMMSIQEYNVDEFMSPFGIDTSKINSSCKVMQGWYYWTALILSCLIVFYNYLCLNNVINKVKSDNVSFVKQAQTQKKKNVPSGVIKISTSSSSITSIMNTIKNANLANAGFVYEIHPNFSEIFFILIAWLALIMYIFMVLCNYNVLDCAFFKPCFHPVNKDKLYDPYDDQQQQ